MRQPLPCLFVVQGIMPGGKKTKEMKILTGVTGVLKPVRLPALPALPDLCRSSHLPPCRLHAQKKKKLATTYHRPHALAKPRACRERSQPTRACML